MSVTLLRNYGAFASGAIVTLPDTTEAALITQGYATASLATSLPALDGNPVQLITQGGNVALANPTGQTAFTSTTMQGPSILPNAALGGVVITAIGTSSVHVAGTLNISEIFVPHWNTWKGIALLNGATAATDNILCALYGSNGVLLANSAVAGALAANAGTFQKLDFLIPVTLPPGRYFLGFQANGTTTTSMKFVDTKGVDHLTTSSTGTFGTIPATITPPTTFTTAVGCVGQLYTV